MAKICQNVNKTTIMAIAEKEWLPFLQPEHFMTHSLAHFEDW